MVEAPRGASRCSKAFRSAAFISAVENPWWLKNSMSSAATTARLRWGEMASHETQPH